MNISIIDDDEDEEERECFVFSISTTAMSGISLEISLATICIIDNDGRYNRNVHFSHIGLHFDCDFVTQTHR